MATITIAWDDGTTDKITVDYAGTAGTSQMTISSDANQSADQRSKIITVNNGESVEITVSQQGRSRSYSIAYSNGYK